MKKGQIAEGSVVSLEFPNKGIVHTENGERVIVKNTLPGQKVSFQVNKARKGKAEARLLEVLEPSPIEVESPCPHAGLCGGCVYQTLPYEEQLALKRAQVQKLMAGVIPGLAPELEQAEKPEHNSKIQELTDGEMRETASGDLQEPIDGADWESEDCDGKKPIDGEMRETASGDLQESIDGVERESASCDEQVAIDGADGELEDRNGKKLTVSGNFGCEFPGILPSPCIYGYRNKMEFSFGDEYKDGPLALGMHKRGSFYDIVTVCDCQIADEDFRRILVATLEYFSEKGTSFFHRMSHEGYLRHLLVRKAARTGEILVDLVTSTQEVQTGKADTVGKVSEERPKVLDEPISVTCTTTSIEDESGALDEPEAMLKEPELQLLVGWRDRILDLQLEGTIKGILHTRNGSVADIIRNDGTDILYGEDHFYEEILGLKFRITPFSFFQTNSLGAEVLYRVAREFILDGDENALRNKTVYDLYSGTGTIAQVIAPVCREVVGVEIVEEAVAAARENAKLNGLRNCKFLAGDVLKVLDTIEEKPDVIILDPPRDGIHPKALEKIIAYGVEKIVYISCKPTSLARDLEVLQARGYRAEKMQCVDMFPGTSHVETVCLLSKLHSKHHIEVELHMDEMDLTAAESKATYEEIKAYVLEHSGLNVSNLYIAQVKQKYGIIERECYNKPKSEDSKQPKCPPEKEAAITEALKYFKMI